MEEISKIQSQNEGGGVNAHKVAERQSAREGEPSHSRVAEDPALKGSKASEDFLTAMENSSAVDQLKNRISYLEELLAGKDAAVIALTQELEAVREMSCIDASIGPLPPGYDVDFKATVVENNRKLQELSAALCQRDEMIQKLADSLKQSVRDREELKKSANHLTEQVHVLQKQLRSVGQQVHQPQTKLREVLKEKEGELLKKSAELSECKAQSSKEVQFLMSSLEKLQQQTAKNVASTPASLEESTNNFSKELEAVRVAHAADAKSLKGQLAEAQKRESLLKDQLERALAECEKLTIDVSSLKLAHEAQLSACQDHQVLRLFSDGAQQESLSVNVQNQVPQQKLIEQNSAAVFESEIQTLRSQLSEERKVSSKQRDKIRLLESQAQEYASDISTCHSTLEQYKRQIDEMQGKLSDDWVQKDANYRAEIILLNGRVSELQETNTRQLNNFHQDLNRMKQKQMEEIALIQLSHENEVNTSKRDAERYRTDLREKTNQLALIEQQLDEERQWSRTYSQQVQELGGTLTKEENKNEEYRKKMKLLEQQLKEGDHACALHQPQIEFLHQQLKDECQKSTNIFQQLEDVRKQLLHEQEKCKAYSKSMAAVQSNIKNEQQHNASLKSEILTLGDQLKQERSRSESYKEEIEEFNVKLKYYLSLEKSSQDLQKQLEEEKQAVAKSNINISTLNQELNDQKMKYNELHLQLQEKKVLVQEYKLKLSELENKLTNFKCADQHSQMPLVEIGDKNELQVGSECDKLQAGLNLNSKLNHLEEQSYVSCEMCKTQINSLKLKIKVLSDTNDHLKKTREDSETELNRVKTLFSSSKNEFELVCQGLNKKLAEREKEILLLQKQRDEISKHKNEIHSYNHQVKELLSAKSLLENELSCCKESYSKEIEALKDQAVLLEEKMKESIKTAEGDTVEVLLKKCRHDLGFLRSLCLSSDVPFQQPSNDLKHGENLSLGLGKSSMFDSPCSVPGLSSLEKLLGLCEKYLNDQLNGTESRETLADHLSKSEFVVEKLKLELDAANNVNSCLQSQRDEVLRKNESLQVEAKFLQSEVDSLKHCVTLQSESSHTTVNENLPNSPRLCDFVSCWVKRCEDLEKSNLSLMESVHELQGKLSIAETKISCNLLSLKKLNSAIVQEKCDCEANFTEEKNNLQLTIDNLRKELLDKEFSNIDKSYDLWKKLTECNKAELSCDENFLKFIKDFSVKAKEVISLQNELQKVKTDCQRSSCENQRLTELLKETQALLEESWQECSTLGTDLQNALKGNRNLKARILHLETYSESIKQRKTSNDLMWQLIQELSSKTTESDHPIPAEDTKCNNSVFEKIESSVQIVKKMNTDCESRLVKLQKDNSQDQLYRYLQSEALGLRRLQSALIETKQAISKKSEPASQLHIDLLQQQLLEEQERYQVLCDSHFSLEAEMREMEERFQQQEEHLQAHLCKQKSAVRYWQLKAEASQAEVTSLRVVDYCVNPSLSDIFAELDSIWSQTLSVLHGEVERVASLRESKVRSEMNSKLMTTERSHKEQLEKVAKVVLAGSSIEALQLLHQQEINAIRAECDYAHFQDILKHLEQMQSNFKHPLLNNINTSWSNLSFLLMKFSISSQFNTAFKKIALSLPNELLQNLSSLDMELEKICFKEDTGSNILPNIDDESVLTTLEQLTSVTEELGKNLADLHTGKLQSILYTCEEKHKLIVGQLKNMSSKVDSLCDVIQLQDELLKLKEGHRLALESITARHKAEESRLRLFLSEQNVNEMSEPTEAAMVVLRRELEEKHKRQMEELRTYFEQKCADFEKHYSEEVFSQHSRKLSDCSSASESEFVSEMYYAGPGSATCSGPGAPSHHCDSLGESSFKEFEEHVRSADAEKLIMDNREQMETMRLALESRHQAELEAQKELYEARFEELLLNMSESHVAELKLQSIRLQDLQDIENKLNNKLSEANEEIVILKQKLNLVDQKENGSTRRLMGKEIIQNFHEQDSPNSQICVEQHVEQPVERIFTYQDREWLESELTAELQRMADALKQRDSESSAQIASLTTELRKNYENMSKLEKDFSNFRSKSESEIQSVTTSHNEKIEEIKELNEKIQQLSFRLEESERLCKQLKIEMASKLTNPLEKCEEEHLKEKDTDFQDKLNKAIAEKKKELESEYAEYLEFVKKCADETKLQLVERHENKLKQINDQHERELAELKNPGRDSPGKNLYTLKLDEKVASNTILEMLGNESYLKESSLSSSLNSLLQLSQKLQSDYQQQVESIIVNICKEISHWQEKLHKEQEMRLESVQKECERRIHLQLEEARADIVQALEHHIQQLLDDDTDGVEKPPELQQLERKFTAKYQSQLKDMQRAHEAQISELCLKHAKQLSIARSKTQIISKPLISLDELNKLHKERDCLRNVAATLRDVVAELVRYFISWEDELNNTLMDELVKLEAARESNVLSLTLGEDSNQLEKDSTHSEDEIPIIVATPASGRRTSMKRVHFAPDITDILSFIDDGSILESAGLNCSIRDTSLNFQEELDRCLARLRSDSAALYALSKPALPTTPTKNQNDSLSITKEPGDNSSKVNNEIPQNIEQLRSENERLHLQLDALRDQQKSSLAELEAARLRLESLEREAYQQAEVVTEGFGEGDQSLKSNISITPRATTVEELHLKSRSLLMGVSNTEELSGVVSPNSGQHISNVVEELCRDWEQMAEESRHKLDDLQQQVEAADKQLRASRTFMDEQAAEREQERDDFVQEIHRLQELLRDKDRDRSSHQQMNHEVETLESQLKETQSTLEDTREKLDKLNTEHKQAVEKIWTLRDIISDLEIQVATKAEEAATVLAQNEALQQMLEQQGCTQLKLAQEMEELQLFSGNGKLVEQITHLEDQLRRHQLIAEQFGDPTVIEQMQSQLHDLYVSLELHTKELECANASTLLPPSPCLSSPSEDVSIRETLEAIRAARDKQASQDEVLSISLPHKEVSRVLEQWQRHSRADDAVLKKIRDLDMQLEDALAEKDVLVSRLQEQMLLSSSLQAKLDEHRCKSEVKLSQATSQMQSQIEDLQSEIHSYVETLGVREGQIENLKSSLRQAEADLKRQGTEVRKNTEEEQNMVAQLQYQVSKLSADKNKLQAILNERNYMHVSLPGLVESMLVDKNADIDRLEKQVLQLSKQIDLSSHYVATPSTTLDFEYCELDKVRAHVELSPVLELAKSPVKSTMNEISYATNNTKLNDTSTSPSIQEIFLPSMASDFKPDTENSLKSLVVTLSESNKENTDVASDTQTSFTETLNTLSLSDCERKVNSLEKELENKNKELVDCLKHLNEKSILLSEVQSRCKILEDSSMKLAEMSKLEEELKEVKDQLQSAISNNICTKEGLEMQLLEKGLEIQILRTELSTAQSTLSDLHEKLEEFEKPHESLNHTMQLQAKESEIQRLREEVCATQTILGNLQRKVQEAKQIARSPSRSSPDNNQALRVVQNALETAKVEIAELKNLCETIRSEVEEEYKLKQAEFKVMLGREQQAKESLQETLDIMIQENKKLAVKDVEKQLEEAKCAMKEKEEQMQKLMAEINQLDMECVALKQQLGTPVSEVVALKTKLDAEKKFSDTLKEELLSFKNRASTLDSECQGFKEKVKELEKLLNNASNGNVSERNDALSKEVSELKMIIQRLQTEQSSAKNKVERLLHENTILKEENEEIGKELSDMKKIIVRLQDLKTSSDEARKCLESKTNDFENMKIHCDKLSEKLFSLRNALKNLDAIQDISGIAEEDVQMLRDLQKQCFSSNNKGSGDGPWNRLSFSDTDVHEICPGDAQLAGLDDLTGMVQHELNVSKQLDHTLLQTLDPHQNQKLPINSDNKKPGLAGAASVKSRGFGSEENATSNESQTQIQTLSEEAAQDKLNSYETELRKLKATLQLLYSQLEAERVQYYDLQQKDCALIEEMRIKLSEALDGQAALRLQLQSQVNHQQTSMFSKKESITQFPSNECPEQLHLQLNEALLEVQKWKEEKEATEKQLRRIQEVEIQRSRRRAVTEERLRRQIDQLQTQHSKTQQECLMLRQELSSVNQKLLLVNEDQAKDRDALLQCHSPFVERLKSMNNFLEEHIQENIRMAKQMEDLTEEHRKLRSRIAQLEKQLADKNNSESLEASKAHFAAERAKWEAERKILLLSLNEAKLKQGLYPDSDVEERVSHLFGRYLRMQSYRKALVWQKRYLLSVINGLNESKSLAAVHLASLSGGVWNKPEVKSQKRYHKFRSVVMVMMAIHRMQFMVERWHRGKRIGCEVVVQQTVSQYTCSSSLCPPGQQPEFSFNHPSVPAQDLRCSISQSPPTLERPRQARPQPSSSSQFSRFSQINRSMDPLHGLSESVTNFHLIQQRFDALLSNPPK